MNREVKKVTIGVVNDDGKFEKLLEVDDFEPFKIKIPNTHENSKESK